MAALESAFVSHFPETKDSRSEQKLDDKDDDVNNVNVDDDDDGERSCLRNNSRLKEQPQVERMLLLPS